MQVSMAKCKSQVDALSKAVLCLLYIAWPLVAWPDIAWPGITLLLCKCCLWPLAGDFLDFSRRRFHHLLTLNGCLRVAYILVCWHS
jgi:uncharacterized membrane protein